MKIASSELPARSNQHRMRSKQQKMRNNQRRMGRSCAIAFAVAAVVLSLVWLQAGAAPSATYAALRAPQIGSQRRDVIRFGIDLTLEPLKLAVADFRTGGSEAAPLVRVFNEVLWNDLDHAGIFDLVSKSFYPPAILGSREDLKDATALLVWAEPPVNAEMLAFGNGTVVNGRLRIEGYLYDLRESLRPEVLARRYTDEPTEAAARVIAHRFANAIVERLGGGLPSIADSKIYFCRRTRRDVKEIWVMDYDGANQRPVTAYRSLALTPDVSPDGSRLAFTSYSERYPRIFVLLLESGRRLSFHNTRSGLNTTPAWSPDGRRIALSSSLSGNPEIYVANSNGTSPHRLTHSRGVDISPAWNPKTGAQLAFVSGRGGVPQIYLMDDDGSNVERLTSGGGDAVNPAWAPNGKTLAFSWTRGYAPGNYNIFLMDVASREVVQLTHGAGRNEHPRFSPDGRHIVFESSRRGGKQVFTMLADGTRVRALTRDGNNTAPVWSAR